MKPEHPAFPAQWVDGLWRALPGDEFVLVSVASRIDDAARPGRVDASPRKLDCSNDSQDHTVLPYAPASFVVRNAHRSRARESRPATAFAPTPPASTASRPAFRDDREPPLFWVRVIRLYDKSEFV